MKKRILIVEDDKLLREMMSRKLEREDEYDVYVVVDGSEAESKIQELKPDVILLDLILPGTNGFEILESIKQNDDLKDIPVIVLSNLGQKSEVEKGISLGAVDYLVKAHFTPAEVVEKIKKVSS
ncbi:MAG: PleD family two-component system response regulator [Candidatus Paceibacterota bacterium]